MHKDIKEILISEEEIKKKVSELAGAVTKDYKGLNFIAVAVLNGSFIFCADIIRKIDLDVNINFMSVSSYGTSTTSAQLKITQDITADLSDKHILIFEDIVDTGKTLSSLIQLFKERGASSVEICSLLDKPSRRVSHVNIKYTGFTIPDAFVVGYGLDYANNYRDLPYIGILKPELYTF